jgi:hypothetical protein
LGGPNEAAGSTGHVRIGWARENTRERAKVSSPRADRDNWIVKKARDLDAGRLAGQVLRPASRRHS